MYYESFLNIEKNQISHKIFHLNNKIFNHIKLVITHQKTSIS